MGLSRGETEAGGATGSRHAAALILDAILERRVPFEEAWDSESRRLDQLSRRDRAFARLLVATALRRLGEIDRLLAGRMRKPPSGKASIVLQILRLGVAQLRFLETPPHAAIDQAVRLTRRCGQTGMSGLVNAVLRNIPALPGLGDEAAARANVPEWLRQSWSAAYGADTAAAIARAHLVEPPLDLSVKADAAAWAERLGGMVLPTGSIRLPRAGDVPALAGFAEGAWWVQDAAAALAVRLLASSPDLSPGAEVLDLCAAPGGKTAQLVAMGARVTAIEADPRRAELLRSNLQRLGLEASVVVTDAASFKPDRAPGLILLDAPCTATGTLRRHPDIAWLKSADDVARMASVQRRMLARAAELLAPGGRLVYAVCSLQQEEGAAQIERLLDENPRLRRVPVQPADVPGLEDAITATGDLLTLPAMWPEHGHLDGFFIARIEKPA